MAQSNTINEIIDIQDDLIGQLNYYRNFDLSLYIEENLLDEREYLLNNIDHLVDLLKESEKNNQGLYKLVIKKEKKISKNHEIMFEVNRWFTFFQYYICITLIIFGIIGSNYLLISEKNILSNNDIIDHPMMKTLYNGYEIMMTQPQKMAMFVERSYDFIVPMIPSPRYDTQEFIHYIITSMLFSISFEFFVYFLEIFYCFILNHKPFLTIIRLLFQLSYLKIRSKTHLFNISSWSNIRQILLLLIVIFIEIVTIIVLKIRSSDLNSYTYLDLY
jgi:hypothetical protein